MDHLVFYLIVSLGIVVIIYGAWLYTSWRKRSQIFRALAQQYGLAFTENTPSFWTLISVDVVRGDTPFVWRELRGSIKGREIVIQDIERQGLFWHPWWYRSPPTRLSTLGVSSETRLVSGTEEMEIGKLYPAIMYNTFASAKVIVDALEQL